MNRIALEQLERVVTDAPDELFVMNVFEDTLPCGTVRCAAGWASVDPWFRENHRVDRNWDRYSVIFGIPKEDVDALFGARLEGLAWDSSDPARRRPRHEVTKLEVVANIRRLLRGEHARHYSASLET